MTIAYLAELKSPHSELAAPEALAAEGDGACCGEGGGGSLDPPGGGGNKPPPPAPAPGPLRDLLVSLPSFF